MTRVTTCSLTVLFSAALLALAPSALGVDGTVLINQSTSVNGLTGCPHTGFPIIICHSGSYHLSGNLSISDVNTNAIEIFADNVTLDLNGFAISGPVTCKAGTYPVQCSALGSGQGIVSEGDNITITNGTVSGTGGNGIYLGFPGGLNVLVQGMHVKSTGGIGIFVVGGNVVQCTVTTNRLDGINVFGSATISLNTLSYNGGNGITGGGVVSNNTVSNNGQDGINGSTAALNNAALGNISWGIHNARGYGSNVSAANGFGAITGGASMHNNICDGAGC
jgi:hypothetical protein